MQRIGPQETLVCPKRSLGASSQLPRGCDGALVGVCPGTRNPPSPPPLLYVQLCFTCPPSRKPCSVAMTDGTVYHSFHAPAKVAELTFVVRTFGRLGHSPSLMSGRSVIMPPTFSSVLPVPNNPNAPPKLVLVPAVSVCVRVIRPVPFTEAVCSSMGGPSQLPRDCAGRWWACVRCPETSKPRSRVMPSRTM